MTPSTDQTRAATWTHHASLYGGTVAALAASPAWAEDHTVFAATMAGLFRSDDAGRSWTRTAEGFTGLSFAGLAVSPSWRDDHTLLVASIDGTIFRVVWGKDGPLWTTANLRGRQVSVSALGISPNFAQDSTAFAATMGDGVLRTRDRGASWDAWNFGLLDLEVLALAISPNFAEDETIFAATGSGIFRSPNAGRAWRELSFPDDAGVVLALAISPDFSKDQTLFAGTEEGHIYRSTDGGRRWKQLRAPFDGEFLNVLHLSPRFATDQTVVALTEAAVYVSEDAGAHWTRTADAAGAMSMALPPTFSLGDESVTVVAGLAHDGVASATGTLQSFTPSNDGLAGRLLSGITAAKVGDATWVATWGPSEGVFVSVDGGATFGEATGDLPTVEVSDVVIAERDGTPTLFAALPEGVYTSTVIGQWHQLTEIPATQVRLSPAFATDGIMFATTADRGLYISTDAGANWTATDKIEQVHAIVAIAVSPRYADDRTLVMAARGIDGSIALLKNVRGRWGLLAVRNEGGLGAVLTATVTDDTVRWFAAIDADVYGPLDEAGGDTGVAIDESAPRIVAVQAHTLNGTPTLFAATEAGLYVSDDDATSWRAVEGEAAQAIAAVAPSVDGSSVFALALGGDIWSLTLD